MVTVRTYWSPAQAALAKSVLDNYEIPSSLLDENASLYNRGAQFAVPIRLVVDEHDAHRADLVLNADFEKAGEIGDDEASCELPLEPASVSDQANRNPWEFLVLAFYVLLPAACLLLAKFPSHIAGRYAPYYVARVTITRFLSWIAVIGAVLLIGFYFAVRRSVGKTQTSLRARNHENS